MFSVIELKITQTHPQMFPNPRSSDPTWFKTHQFKPAESTLGNGRHIIQVLEGLDFYFCKPLILLPHNASFKKPNIVCISDLEPVDIFLERRTVNTGKKASSIVLGALLDYPIMCEVTTSSDGGGVSRWPLYGQGTDNLALPWSGLDLLL